MKCFAHPYTNETKVYAQYDLGPLSDYGPVKKYNPGDEKPCGNKCEGVEQLRRELHKWEAYHISEWAPFTSGRGLFSDETMTDYGRVIERTKRVLDMSSKGSYLPYKYFHGRPVESNASFYSARFARYPKFETYQCDAIQSAAMLVRGNPVSGKYNRSRPYCAGVDKKKIPRRWVETEAMAKPILKFVKDNLRMMSDDLGGVLGDMLWEFTVHEKLTKNQESEVKEKVYELFTTLSNVFKDAIENTKDLPDLPPEQLKLTSTINMVVGKTVLKTLEAIHGDRLPTK